MIKNKEDAIRSLSKSPKFDSFEFKHYYDDKEVVLKAVEMNGNNLEHASDRLKDDKEVVLKSIQYNGLCLSHAGEKLKDDREVVKKAIENDIFGWVLQSASDRLKDDKELVLQAVKKHPIAIDYASPGLRQMCEGSDPVKALESAIAYEDLKSKIAVNPKQEIKKIIKI